VAANWRMLIGEVVARTGLSERTVRFYEQEGLIDPRRTDAGRRIYDRAELTTLYRITALKRAGFSLSEIKRLLDSKFLEVNEVIRAQISVLEKQRAALNEALTRLKRAEEQIAVGTQLDVGSLCELILVGGREMEAESWKEYFDKHYTAEEQKRWKEVKLRASQGDPEGYFRKFDDLVYRIEQALPLDPASDAARSYLAEWQSLLAPFADSLEDDMKPEASKFLSSIARGAPDAPINRRVFEFMVAVKHATKSR